MTRHETLLKRLGSKKAVKEHYREMQRKSRLHPNNKKGGHRGGFSDPETAKKASRLGVLARTKARQDSAQESQTTP